MFDDISEASYARVFRYTLPGKDNRYIMLLMGNNRGTRRITSPGPRTAAPWKLDARRWWTRRRAPLRSHQLAADCGCPAKEVNLDVLIQWLPIENWWLGMPYRADITAGSLKLAESRVIADLLLRRADEHIWKEAVMAQNVLQTRNPATASRMGRLIRQRLELMNADLWRLVRDGSAVVG